ncbi:CPBP family intramembrane glutamic endopeptidase [Streptomyces sp. DH10]|uniref:CPBP family intramembrane glutamic endopeptidase n=1 Tax=Streptomyces sp. DH10 TaxID=3040121 RepID=UPI002442763B|nr:CPBP family intramembrane metalloprotease [Streptomyces sp. DH10]MDG9712727.1 CPBP family intramembrane metalloprotease [Streptomyces sp. DH10]
MRMFCVLAVLVAANLLNNWLAPDAYVPTCVAAAAALLLIARWDGLTRADLGLDKAALHRGLRWSFVLVGAVIAVFLAGLALPVTREAFEDERAVGLTVGKLLWRVLIRVPVGTVLLEEIAFRGVLWAMVRRRRGTAWATAASSSLFGLWHVLPSRGLSRANEAVAVLGTGPAGTALSVAAAVVATTAAGVVLCELRRRSGSLLAPASLHWALNGFGYVLAWALPRWRGVP